MVFVVILRVTYHVEAKLLNHLKSSKYMAQPSIASQLLQAEAEQLLASIRRFAAAKCAILFSRIVWDVSG